MIFGLLMKKQISILFLALLLSPVLFKSVNSFFGHQHEICSADGIHFMKLLMIVHSA